VPGDELPRTVDPIAVVVLGASVLYRFRHPPRWRH